MLRAERRVEQKAAQMRRRPDPSGAAVELVLVLLGVGDELGRGLHRQVLPHQQDLRHVAHEADRLEVVHRVVGQLLVEADIGGERAGVADEERVAVGLGPCGTARADRATGARDVLDQHLLAKLLRQALGHDACQAIRRPAGREGHDGGDGPARIRVLRIGTGGIGDCSWRAPSIGREKRARDLQHRILLGDVQPQQAGRAARRSGRASARPILSGGPGSARAARRENTVDHGRGGAEIVGRVGQPLDGGTVEMAGHFRLGRQDLGQRATLLVDGAAGGVDDVVRLLAADVRAPAPSSPPRRR